MKYAAPLIGSWVSMADEEYYKLFKNDITFMKELTNKLPNIGISHEPELSERGEGAPLRTLRHWLKKKTRSSIGVD